MIDIGWTGMKARILLPRLAVIALLAASIWAVQGGQVLSQTLSEPERNFEYLWNKFDLDYALFDAKHIDWQALYNIYRPQVTAGTTDDELFAIMSKMLGHLNDNHVQFGSSDPQREFVAGYLWDIFGKHGSAAFMAMVGQRPAPAKYFKQLLKEAGDGIFAYGWLDDGIGYCHFKAFANAEASAKAIDEILAEFKDADGLVLDVRRNTGGDDRVGQMLAGRFADKKRLYMTTQERNGPHHSDFDPKRYFFVEPGGPAQFTKNVILLTDRLSISAAENFVLAMRILPHVTVVGDFTSGCFADMYDFKLPNGWNVSLSLNLFLDKEGFCWEGIGVPPDIKVACTYDEVAPENDAVLETAIALIGRGELSPQPEEENIGPTWSLANLLEENIAAVAIETAISNYNERRAQDGGKLYYCSYYEMQSLGARLLAAGNGVAGEAVLAEASRTFPEVPRPQEMLCIEYLKQKRDTEARQALDKALALRQARSMPQSRQFNQCLADVLLKEYLSGGISALGLEYAALQEKYPAEMTEGMLNDLGYLLLGCQLTQPAIEVLALNVERFPQSSNAYDSLGEAYMKAGNRTLAIENYEESVRLNPENANGTEMLKTLKEVQPGTD